MRVSRQKHRAFMLLEVLVATMLIGVALLYLLQVQNQTLVQFMESKHDNTGVWLAEMKMAELMAEDLPDPSEPGTFETSDSGDFEFMDDRYNEVNSEINDNWKDREIYYQYKYEWSKELIFIGSDFIGAQEDLDNWEPSEDASNSGEDAIADEDPNSKPAARVVRITLKVYHEDNKGKVDPITTLVTYVDPAMLYEAGEEEEDPSNPEDEGAGR
ncbi:MAG: hypothetical protein L3J82_07405 [Planctomycetes bacterium]|nr:hypothetical protein [Planctomycetota bacterium]